MTTLLDESLICRAEICLPRLEHLKNYGDGAFIHSATNKFGTLDSALKLYKNHPIDTSYRALQITVTDCERYLIDLAKTISLSGQKSA